MAGNTGISVVGTTALTKNLAYNEINTDAYDDSAVTETCSRCARTIYLDYESSYDGLCEDCATTCPVCGRHGYPYNSTAQTQIMFIRHHGKCMRCFSKMGVNIFAWQH
jgi:hypothetical protein